MPKKRKQKYKGNAPKTDEYFEAVQAGDVGKVKQILKAEEVYIDIQDQSDPTEPTALQVACRLQNLSMVSLLVKAKPQPANIDTEDNKGRRPLWCAVKYNNTRLTRILLEDSGQTVDVNFIDPGCGCTPLYQSVLLSNPHICRLLIHAGANVNLRQIGLNSKGESPLMKAVQLDNIEICELLINSLCQMQVKSTDGLTALHYAVAYRRYEIAEFLLKNRIKVMSKSNKGVTAMTIAIEQYNPLMVKLLTEFGYNINHKFDWGETPLEMAIKFHSEECALTLVRWGCSLKRSKEENSYFYAAATEGLMKLTKLLLDVNPAYLNETWVRKKEIPLALYTKPEFCEWLFDLASSPRPLTIYCQAKICSLLGKYSCHKVTQLPLPPLVQTSLSHSKFFHDDMYKGKTLYDTECPFDCCSKCIKENCTKLEIHSSDSE